MWPPTGRALKGALLISCVVFGLIGLIQLIPEGAIKRVVETVFHILVGVFVVVMIILAGRSWVQRAEDDGWND